MSESASHTATQLGVISHGQVRTVQQSRITWDPFYEYGLHRFPVWISNYIHYKVWEER